MRGRGRMRRGGRGARRAVAACVVVLAGVVLAGCDGGEEGAAPPASQASAAAMESSAESPASTQAVMANLTRTVGIAHEKLVGLAQAMPAETWAWRPMEGVRSVGEIYQHVAADNWFGPALMGVPSPEGVGVTEDGETVAAYQGRAMSREEVIAELERSFVHLEAALEDAAARAEDEVSLRGSRLTVADLSVRLIVHMHEHLGQAVAYARANEVVPPWSR